MQISNKPYESLLLNTKPISGPSVKSQKKVSGIIGQYQKRERPFSAREYVETQKALLKAKQERNRFVNDDGSTSSNSKWQPQNDTPSLQQTVQKAQVEPAILRFDPFAEELERDNRTRDSQKKYLTVPPHLRVVSNKYNVAMKLDENDSSGKATVAPFSQVSQYEHSPSIVKAQMLQSMKQYSTNPRMWVRSVLGATLDRGFYEIPKVELSSDATNQILDSDHAGYLEVFDHENVDTYDEVSIGKSNETSGKHVHFRPTSASSEEYWDLLQNSSEMYQHLDRSNRNTVNHDKYMYDIDDYRQNTLREMNELEMGDSTQREFSNYQTDSRRVIHINQDFNIVTRPYTSIPQIDPNIELLRVESQHDRNVQRTLLDDSSSQTSYKRTFFDTDSETADVDSVHTGIDSDFMEAAIDNPIRNSLEALRKASINTPSVRFDIRDSSISNIVIAGKSEDGVPLFQESQESIQSQGIEDLYEKYKHESNTNSSAYKNTHRNIKSLESQFDDLTLGKDLEEVVASIFASPSQRDEISVKHKSLLASSISIRQKQQDEEENRKNLKEYKKLHKELERLSTDPSYFRP